MTKKVIWKEKMKKEEVKVQNTQDHKMITYAVIFALFSMVIIGVKYAFKSMDEVADKQPRELQYYAENSFTLKVSNNHNDRIKLNKTLFKANEYINFEYNRDTDGLYIYKDFGDTKDFKKQIDSGLVLEFMSTKLPHCVLANHIFKEEGVNNISLDLESSKNSASSKIEIYKKDGIYKLAIFETEVSDNNIYSNYECDIDVDNMLILNLEKLINYKEE
jgi:hypothetical protein